MPPFRRSRPLPDRPHAGVRAACRSRVGSRAASLGTRATIARTPLSATFVGRSGGPRGRHAHRPRCPSPTRSPNFSCQNARASLRPSRLGARPRGTAPFNTSASLNRCCGTTCLLTASGRPTTPSSEPCARLCLGATGASARSATPAPQSLKEYSLPEQCRGHMAAKSSTRSELRSPDTKSAGYLLTRQQGRERLRSRGATHDA